MKKSLFALAIVCHMALSAGWSPPINIYTDNPAGLPAVGIDSNGNAVIGYSWLHIMDANIGATQLINGVPMNTVAFSVALFTGGPANTLNIAVNASGNATLIWTEFNGVILYRLYSLHFLFKWSLVYSDCIDRSLC